MSKTKEMPVNFGDLGLITFARTYSREKKNGEKETFSETVERELRGVEKQLKLKLSKSDQAFYRKMRHNMWGSVAGRFMWQLGTNTVDKLGLSSLQNCFGVETEFITRDGIKSFLDFSSGDHVLVRGKLGWKDARVVNFGKSDLVELKLRKGKRVKKIRTTLNHRWKSKFGSIVETKDLKVGTPLDQFESRLNFDTLRMCKVGIQHGIIYGDGHKISNGESTALTKVGDSLEETSEFFDITDAKMISGLPYFYKDLPNLSKANSHYIYGFLAGWFLADGSIGKNGSNITLANKSPEVLNWARGAFSFLGISTSDINYSRKKSPFDNSEKPLYRITIDRENLSKEFFLLSKHSKRFKELEIKLDWKVDSISNTVSNEDVWCVVEPDSEEFTLSCGVLTKNCAFTVIDEPIRPFTWTMDMLMLGSGVGYSIKREHVYKLPKVSRRKITIEEVKDAGADFIVPDTREGWVKLLGKVLKSYFYSGKGFTYSTQLIREKGEPIKGFGGVASGAGILIEGIASICEIIDKQRGKQLRPIDCLDIMNIIGSIVVAGNVRRSAQIAIGDCDDIEFLKAKRWDLGVIPAWRAMSNNSVDVHDAKLLPKEFWDTYKEGEPYGLINLELARSVGRLGETQYPDPTVEGFNPSLRAGTKVWTIDGIKPIERLEDKSFLVKNLDGEIVPAECWLSSSNAQLYEITLQGGHKYYCTPEHKWAIYTPQGYIKCETTDLKEGHLLPINKFNSYGFGDKGDYSDGFFIGWLYGDGGIHIRKDNGKPQLNLIVSKKDDESNISSILLEKLNSLKETKSSWSERKGNKELYCSARAVFDYLDSYGVDYLCEKIPTSIWKDASEDFRKGFLDAIFSSDGTVESNYKSAKVRLTSSKELFIRDVSEMLGFYGIKNNIHSGRYKLNNKNFDRFTLDITSRENISHFKSLFKLSVKHKQDRLFDVSDAKVKPLWGSVYKILSIKKTEIHEPVWDIRVMDNTHCFQISHVITGNCAEQSLASKETCCLAEIYLPNVGSYEDLVRVAKILYKINKHSLSLKSHHPETQDIVNKKHENGYRNYWNNDGI